MQEDPRLNDFDTDMRRTALAACAQALLNSATAANQAVNLHCHTFHSYNAHGLSPSGVACRLKSLGVAAGGIVDFDTLAGVEEFLSAADSLQLPACAGIETRVFIPELSHVEINSPGEPGIAYHMGVGFVRSAARNSAFLASLKSDAQSRNQAIIGRVNEYLAPVAVDYARDILPLAPSGNPTERHLCVAYNHAASNHFPNADERLAFWRERLGVDAETLKNVAANDALFQNLLRRKLMKRGGPGYIQPDTQSFPRLDEFNRFVRDEGAIPTVAWLDGTSDGEQNPDALLDLHLSHGALALNIIPDRNWNIDDEDDRAIKIENLAAIVDSAQRKGMPIFVGTEMNAPGQPDVDNFDADALTPHIGAFLDGARAACAHTLLERHAGMGYLSPWAKNQLPELSARQRFYGSLPFGATGANVHDGMTAAALAEALEAESGAFYGVR